MELTALIDRTVPGPGSRLDRVSEAIQARVRSASRSPGLGPVTTALRGDEWLGHPLHPVVVAVPIGGWVVGAWYDARSARTGDPGDEHAADGATTIGVAGALAAAVTGVVQIIDARDQARRETGIHAALNNAALLLYVASLVQRRRGGRPLGRRLALAGLGLVSLSGWIGGDIAFRHGVGMRRS